MEIIEQRRLDNGMMLTVYDQSEKLAGDRWLLRVVCEAALPVEEVFFEDFSADAAELQAEVGKRMAGVVIFSVVKKKTFIDQAERSLLLSQMVAEIFENMAKYLDSPKFPERLFAHRYESLKAQCLAEHRRLMLQATDADMEDDDGPADFSTCFKD